MISATPDQDQDQDGRIMVLFQANPEMSSLGLLQSLKESMLSQANVKAIYGGPIAAHSKTVIPVAKIKIMYGYRTGGALEVWALAVRAVEEHGRFQWALSRSAISRGIGLGLWLGRRRRR